MANLLRYSHFHRYRQIAEILLRHGMGYLVSSFGLKRFVPLRAGIRRYARPNRRYTRSEHVRMVFEELGATFIKLGQILSTRSDILPLDYIAELAKLQDQAPPVDGSLIWEMIVEELGCPIEKVFATFDPESVAAASIGQAHAATLHTGAEVIVKVRRPGVVEQIEEDLEILQNLAITASRHWEVASHYDLPGLAQEFAHTLRAELDYMREGRNTERFAIHLANHPFIHISCVYWGTTTKSVLTLERIQGIKMNDLAALDAAGIDRPKLERRSRNTVHGKPIRCKPEIVPLLGELKRESEGGNKFRPKEGRHGGDLGQITERRIEGDDLYRECSIGFGCFVSSIHHKCRLSISARRR